MVQTSRDLSKNQNTWWNCKILGPAQEEAVLNSLGLPQGNIEPDSFNRRPDGYITRTLVDFLFHSQPFFIEVKGKYGNFPNETTFDYSNQMGQFDDYRNFLKSPMNTHKPTTSVIHGLYMILPADVSLASNIILACSVDNIPLYYSGIEYNTTNPSEVRVKKPELLNPYALDFSAHLVDFAGADFMKWCNEKEVLRLLDYVETTINFQHFANQFENNSLTSNLPPDSGDCIDE